MGRILAASLVSILAICGCVSPLRNGTSGGGGGGSVGGKLYVSTPSSILRFGNALTASGNVAPEATVSGGSTQLSSPQRIAADTSTDRLFVANKSGSSVLVFSTASTMTGNAAPSAVLTSTGNIASPVDVAIDPTNNLLYVADGQNLLVFTGESSLSGSVNTPPARIVNFTFTIGAIFLDVSSNTMIIVDPADNAVDIMPSASTANGSGALLVSPLAGSATLLSAPNGATIDSGGRLIVSNTGTGASITIYPAATIPSGGDVPPVAQITGTTSTLGAPGQMVINSGAGSSGELYVADSLTPGVVTFLNIGAVTGTVDPAPSRAIVGSGTSLTANAVNGLALDTTR